MNLTPGKKTTEFWLTLGISTAALWMGHAEKIDGTTGVVTAGVLGIVYTIFRNALKARS